VQVVTEEDDWGINWDFAGGAGWCYSGRGRGRKMIMAGGRSIPAS
jgi:hypothetical protein